MRISRASLDAVAEERASRLELQLFNRADGLPSDACRRGYQPSAFKASDGQLWFATHKGAISVHPQDITQSTFEPPATIEEIRAELEQIVVTPANRDHIDIPAGTRHMTIRCSVPSLGKPDYARFQYTMEGFDSVWRDAGGDRVIRFYDLQPGKYRFLVRAIGTDGRFVETPASVVLIVHPFYWQELWFRALCLLALVFVVAFVVWRSQQQRIRLQEEKLRAQETHAELVQQLQQAQKMDALGRLAGGIAHDFNNLLTSVGGNAELLQAELPAQSREREIVNDIAAAAGRARELVSQILTFSRRRAVEKVALDPAPVLREAVQLLRAGLPAMIELQADVPETLPPILGDAAQVQRIIMNLGTNAAQAIGAKTGRIRISAQECEVQADSPVDGVPTGHYVRLVVSDDGRGMDDQTLSRIFDPFFTTKAIGQGTGLGLSVVHGIVEAYGGHITVESEPAAGTIFQIYFPVTDQAPARPRSRPAAGTPAVAPGSGDEESILLVDDEAGVLKVSRTMLERLGYTVEGHTDPLAAAAAFAAAPDRYRLLITDFAMPRLDGVELARRIWKERPGFPAILYTGYGGRLTANDAERMGFVELLAKPFTMQKLGDAVAARAEASRKPRWLKWPEIACAVRMTQRDQRPLPFQHRTAVLLAPRDRPLMWSLGGVLVKSVEWPSMAKAGARSAIGGVVLLALAAPAGVHLAPRRRSAPRWPTPRRSRCSSSPTIARPRPTRSFCNIPAPFMSRCSVRGCSASASGAATGFASASRSPASRSSSAINSVRAGSRESFAPWAAAWPTAP